MKRYNKKRMIVISLLAAVGLLLLIEVMLLLVLRSQLDRYANYWHENNKRPAQSGELVYVALGDSTAQGIGATSPGRGYVGLTAKALERKTGRPVRIVNLSKSGAKLADCLSQQLPRLAAHQADVVTIEIGANDLGAFDETAFRRDMEQIMAKLPDHAVISDMPYFGGGRRRVLEPRAQTANNIINELAASRDLSVAPLHRITKERDSLLTFAVDLFHPSNRGYRNWFDAFWSVLGQR